MKGLQLLYLSPLTVLLLTLPRSSYESRNTLGSFVMTTPKDFQAYGASQNDSLVAISRSTASSILECSRTCKQSNGACTGFSYDAEDTTCDMYHNCYVQINKTVYMAQASYCPEESGFQWFSFHHCWFCLAYVNISLSYQDANSVCDSYGAELFQFENNKEKQFVPQLFLSSLGVDYTGVVGMYVGLTDLEEEGVFRWASSNNVADPADLSWYPGEPNNSQGYEQCATVAFYYSMYEGRLNDVACSLGTNFVCEMPSLVRNR